MFVNYNNHLPWINPAPQPYRPTTTTSNTNNFLHGRSSAHQNIMTQCSNLFLNQNRFQLPPFLSSKMSYPDQRTPINPYLNQIAPHDLSTKEIPFKYKNLPMFFDNRRNTDKTHFPSLSLHLKNKRKESVRSSAPKSFNLSDILTASRDSSTSFEKHGTMGIDSQRLASFVPHVDKEQTHTTSRDKHNDIFQYIGDKNTHTNMKTSFKDLSNPSTEFLKKAICSGIHNNNSNEISNSRSTDNINDNRNNNHNNNNNNNGNKIDNDDDNNNNNKKENNNNKNNNNNNNINALQGSAFTVPNFLGAKENLSKSDSLHANPSPLPYFRESNFRDDKIRGSNHVTNIFNSPLSKTLGPDNSTPSQTFPKHFHVSKIHHGNTLMRNPLTGNFDTTDNIPNNSLSSSAAASAQLQSSSSSLSTPSLPTSSSISLSQIYQTSQERKKFQCPQCRYITDRKNNLMRHIITMHQDSGKVLECCGIVFQSKAALREHNSIFHAGGYRCQICSRNFCRKALLRRHLTVHSGQKDFYCELCGYATSHKSNLERHQKVHNKRYIGRICFSNYVISQAAKDGKDDDNDNNDDKYIDVTDNEFHVSDSMRNDLTNDDINQSLSIDASDSAFKYDLRSNSDNIQNENSITDRLSPFSSDADSDYQIIDVDNVPENPTRFPISVTTTSINNIKNNTEKQPSMSPKLASYEKRSNPNSNNCDSRKSYRRTTVLKRRGFFTNRIRSTHCFDSAGCDDNDSTLYQNSDKNNVEEVKDTNQNNIIHREHNKNLDLINETNAPFLSSSLTEEGKLREDKTSSKGQFEVELSDVEDPLEDSTNNLYTNSTNLGNDIIDMDSKFEPTAGEDNASFQHKNDSVLDTVLPMSEDSVIGLNECEDKIASLSQRYHGLGVVNHKNILVECEELDVCDVTDDDIMTTSEHHSGTVEQSKKSPEWSHQGSAFYYIMTNNILSPFASESSCDNSVNPERKDVSDQQEIVIKVSESESIIGGGTLCEEQDNHNDTYETTTKVSKRCVSHDRSDKMKNHRSNRCKKPRLSANVYPCSLCRKRFRSQTDVEEHDCPERGRRDCSEFLDVPIVVTELRKQKILKTKS